jgi:deoxyribodipyrimidine photolyase-related protein
MPRTARPRSAFARALDARQPELRKRRRWCYVPYDQLSDGLGLLARAAPEDVGIVLVENPGKAARRPYHRQKLALVLTNLRHFALEQAARGVAVRYLVADDRGYPGALAAAARELGPLALCEPAERELRSELAPLFGDALRLEPHTGWLTTADHFRRAHRHAPDGPFRMDAFYRLVRRELDVLMERGKPVGGKLSFDADNRQSYRGVPPAPVPPRFAPDEITIEVCDLVERAFASHPGQLDPAALPATASDAEALWAWALRDCLPTFGPFEDARTTRSSGLFHTRISALLNLHRLLPRRVLASALAAPIPLSSKEGFVRQILGWREFVRHVHAATDGLRQLRGRAMHTEAGGAAPSHLGAARPLPPVYWGQAPSGLACLDHVVADVWREGYSHHITRLMVLGNLAALLDVSPRQLTDWFWAAYTDAFDWVVEPNVLGMATFAAGDVMTTKPYIAGAAYIDRMSDYCHACAFSPKRDCPITPLYWAYLQRHADALAENPRMLVPLAALRKRPAETRAEDLRTFERVSAALTAGRSLA